MDWWGVSAEVVLDIRVSVQNEAKLECSALLMKHGQGLPPDSVRQMSARP